MNFNYFLGEIFQQLHQWYEETLFHRKPSSKKYNWLFI